MHIPPINIVRHFIPGEYAICCLTDGTYAFTWGDVVSGDTISAPAVPTAEAGVFVTPSYKACVVEWRNLAFVLKATKPTLAAEMLAEVA